MDGVKIHLLGKTRETMMMTLTRRTRLHEMICLNQSTRLKQFHLAFLLHRQNQLPWPSRAASCFLSQQIEYWRLRQRVCEQYLSGLSMRQNVALYFVYARMR